MTPSRTAEPLLSYTEWLRTEWRSHLADHPGALSVGVGDHADGRFGTVGETIRHVFGAEIRYVDRISGRPARDVTDVATESLDALFGLGAASRHALRTLLEDGPPGGWDGVAVYPIGAFEFEGTPWKIVMHALVHEVRHWAQIGTILRLAGMGPPLQDLLVSPVLGGDFRRRG